jgi:hypothetical protein
VPTDLSLSRDELELLAAGSAVVAVLSLLLVLLALARTRALGKRLRRLGAAGGTAAAPPAQTGDGPLAPPPDPTALRHVAVVRYDAFGDMGGRLSFSAALLDGNGDGLVISSINGRSETRTYAKSLRGMESEHRLSPEEERAIAQASEPPGDRPRGAGGSGRRERPAR